MRLMKEKHPLLLQGVFLPAADVDFHIDVDPTSGGEMVTVDEAKPIRRQGDCC